MLPGCFMLLGDREKEQKKTCQAYCEPVLYLTCSAEFLNNILKFSAVCSYLLNCLHSSWITWVHMDDVYLSFSWHSHRFLCRWIHRKVSLKPFYKPDHQNVTSRPTPLHSLLWQSWYSQKQPCSRGLLLLTTWWGSRKLGIHFSQTGAQMWQQSKVINFLCPELEI